MKGSNSNSACMHPEGSPETHRSELNVNLVSLLKVCTGMHSVKSSLANTNVQIFLRKTCHNIYLLNEHLLSGFLSQ